MFGKVRINISYKRLQRIYRAMKHSKVDPTITSLAKHAFFDLFITASRIFLIAFYLHSKRRENTSLT